MLFEELTLADKKYDFTLIQTKKNKVPIDIIDSAFARSLTLSLTDINSLTFIIPYYILDQISNQKIVNPNYTSIKEENMVLLKAGEDISSPSFESYFVIKKITESSDKMTKIVECKSREVILNKLLFTSSGIERELVNATVGSEGILNLVAQETTWNIGYVQPSVLIDTLDNASNVPRVRWLDASSKPILQFLNTDIATAYNCIFFYDTVNKLINCYDKDSYGTHTGILLSEDSYIKEFAKVTNSEEVCTKLIASGNNGLTIETATLDGTSTVSNYSYYIQNGQMSSELITALSNYNSLLVQKDVSFKALKVQLDSLNSTLTTKQGELATLEEQLVALLRIQTAYMKPVDPVNLPTATNNVNAKNTAITSKKAEIASLNSQITVINTQMAQISADIDKKTAKYNNVLIFNTGLLEELEDFTQVEIFQSDAYTNAELLKKAAEDYLVEKSIIPCEFSMQVTDFFALKEAQMYWNKVKIGDFVRGYSEKMNLNLDFRIIGYTYAIDENNLSMTFSNKDKKIQDMSKITNTISKSNDVAKTVSTKRLEWDKIKDTSTAVSDFLGNALDCAKQEILSKQGNNKISITENGIFVQDTTNEDHQLAILSGVIGFTSDGWQTCNTAIDNAGVYAKYLVGEILIGENLVIKNANSSFEVTEDGVTITNSSGIDLSGNTQFQGAMTEITANANAISLKASTNYVDSIQVGGRNLYKGTADFNSTYWVKNGVSQISTCDYDSNYKMATISGADYANTVTTTTASQGFNFSNVTKTWTITAMFKGTASGQQVGVTLCGVRINWQPTAILNGSWKKVSWTFTGDGNTLATFRFECPTATASLPVYFAQVKIEEGNKSTDWTPAPEDVQKNIDNIQIGGRNLLPNSDTVSFSPNGTGTGTSVLNTDFYRATPAVGVAVSLYHYFTGLTLKTGDIYSFSFDVRTNGNTSLTSYVRNGSNTATISNTIVTTLTSGVWTRVKIEGFTCDSGSVASILPILILSTITLYLDYRNFKLESGNKCTDWIPSVEDITSRLDSAELKITSSAIISTVTSSTTYTNDINGKVSTSSLSSEIQQRAGDIQVAFNNISSNVQNSSGVFTIKNGKLLLKNSADRDVMWCDTNGWLVAGNVFITGAESPSNFEIGGSGNKGMGIRATNDSATAYLDFAPLSKEATYASQLATGKFHRIASYGGTRDVLHIEVGSELNILKNNGNGMCVTNISGTLTTLGESNMYNGTSADPWVGIGCFLKGHGNLAITDNFKAGGGIYGSTLSITGSKNCIQKTENYDSRLINAYETAEYYFGDIGFAEITDNNEAVVFIDEIFQECVNMNLEYHVFTQCYNGNIESIDKQKGYFIIRGENGTKFSWELKAKRLGYENHRLEIFEEPEQNNYSNLDYFGDDIVSGYSNVEGEIESNLEDLLLGI